MLSRTARSLLRPSLRTIPQRQRQQRQQGLQGGRQLLFEPRPRVTGAILSRRRYHQSPRSFKGLQPDSSDPEPPKTQLAEGANRLAHPASISTEEYHEIADGYIEELLLSLEAKAELAQPGYEVEYSVTFPPVTFDLYIPSLFRPYARGAWTHSFVTLGWCTHRQHVRRHIRVEQATAEQADLDLIPHIWAQAV